MILATRERFVALCLRLGAKDNSITGRTISDTYDEIIAAYIGPDRHYHNIDHIDEGLALLDEIRHLAEHPDILEMAWWLHDFVYDINTGSPKNEEDSAIFADRILRELGVEVSKRMRVMKRILATTHDHIPVDFDDWLMVDIDLVRLGVSPDDFDKYGEKIREEHGVPVWVFEIGITVFLRKFISSRPSIYLTEYFRERYETQAQENIKRVLAQAGIK